MSKSKVDIWMPIYIGDYLKDTGRLSTEAHGAYFLLMLDYWANGAPPLDNDEELASITRMPLEAWRGLRSRLERYFEVRDGRWFHKRIEADLEKARARAATAARNGARGGRPPSGENPEGTQEEPAGFSLGSPEDNPEGNLQESSSKSKSESKTDSTPKTKREGFRPPSLEEVKAYCVERGNSVDAEQFVAFYTTNGWVQGSKGKPVVNWKACVITWEARRSFGSSAGSRAPKPARIRGEHVEDLRL